MTQIVFRIDIAHDQTIQVACMSSANEDAKVVAMHTVEPNTPDSSAIIAKFIQDMVQKTYPQMPPAMLQYWSYSADPKGTQPVDAPSHPALTTLISEVVSAATAASPALQGSFTCTAATFLEHFEPVLQQMCKLAQDHFSKTPRDAGEKSIGYFAAKVS